ncbi:cysteine hydrolase family protein [Nitrospirillum iridis]|uniref:Nicotinamidase-related amidase n=1 Tax=Nitrospirillum iridis TaxID=765888 RepID=A0A7X0EGR8_9PROT|nr:cysteine hydrolase [Nitrospirillum iridis]MBB6254386.1 nicotinamidase-related amidase [Nitrospirillum iridis]
MAHIIALPAWAHERGRGLNDVRTLDPVRTALVVIDMQCVFMAPGEVFGNPHALDIMPAVNRLAMVVRAAGGRVIWTRQTVSADPALAMPPWQYDLSIPFVQEAVRVMTAGNPSHALHPAMDARDGDGVIDKYRYSAFLCPAGALRADLQAHGIDTLLIAGTLTNCCCDSTARDGNMLGYRVVVLADACAAPTDAEHNAALLLLRLNFADVKTVAEVEGLLAASRTF